MASRIGFTQTGRALRLIPNVFRVLSQIDEESRYVLEFQDLSSKIVLVQGTGTKVGSELDEDTQVTKGGNSERERSRHKGTPHSRKPKNTLLNKSS